MLTTLGRVTPYGNFTVLREVSQHTNIKLSQVAEEVLKYAQGAAPLEVLVGEAACGPRPPRRWRTAGCPMRPNVESYSSRWAGVAG
ncbi:ANTAR domain-containing protein [Streptomyces sp. MS1.AVA.1]|uniref:ANTAR domain-containing protein n=1 Tax=Streptomyces machairae TaxID=3134109 RepID=A0ABU8UUU3_9ACTN